MGVNRREASILSEVIGHEAVAVVNILKEKKSVSEFKISKELKKEINETRQILYKLHGADLVECERKKDDDKGWYVYFWMFKPKTMKHFTNMYRKTKLTKLIDRLEREKNHEFFICASKCARLNFDTAFDFEYKCPECGAILEYEEKNGKIVSLQKEVDKMKKALKLA